MNRDVFNVSSSSSSSFSIKRLLCVAWEREREKRNDARASNMSLSLDVMPFKKNSQNHIFRVYKFRVLNEK